MSATIVHSRVLRLARHDVMMCSTCGFFHLFWACKVLRHGQRAKNDAWGTARTECRGKQGHNG